MFYKKIGKRIFDIIFSILGLFFLSPIFVLIYFLVGMTSKGGSFFIQKRIGTNFRKFNLIKFRSMRSNNSGLKITTKNDRRITYIGKFIRKTKIDELPQLLNVLKGDMSFIGPRPEVEKYVRLYKNEYENILKIKPGITDYAAIEFRNEENILEQYEDKEVAYIKEILPKKINLYNKYISNISLKNDFGIIIKTIVTIFKS